MELLVKIEIGEETKAFLSNLLKVEVAHERKEVIEAVAPMVEVPSAEVVAEPVVKAEPTKPSITRDELKAYCSQRKNNDGVDITKILNEQFGVTAFKFLQDDKLQEFYEAVANA